MTVTVEHRGDKFQVDALQTVESALRQLDLDPESYLVIRDGKMITAGSLLIDGDVIKLVPAIAGG